MTDDSHDLIGAYAMDALNASEAAAFELHLQTCPTCRDELVDLHESLADLASSYEVEPPAALRDAVLGAVAELAAAPSASDREAPASLSSQVPSESAPLPTTPTSHEASPSPSSFSDDDAAAENDRSETLATVTPLPRRSPEQARRSRWQVLVAAAVALIAVLGISVWQPWVQRTVTAADVLASSDAVRATGDALGGGTVTVVRSNRLGRAVLVTDALPDAPSDKVRQAWIKRPDGAFVSGGLMPSGANITMLLEGDARDAQGAGVSLEPSGGSAQPSDVLVVVGL